MQASFQCSNCNADFKIKHSQDEDYFVICFCPFCGSDIDIDDDTEEMDEDSE